jgi:FkbM family methyltransferase
VTTHPTALDLDLLPPALTKHAIAGRVTTLFRTIKDYVRRAKLTRRGVVVRRDCSMFTAGARSGVWTVTTEGLDAACVVYSFGVGDNLAWDLAVIERFGLTLHAFDPTPASIAWVGTQSLPPKLTFHPMGVAGHDGSVTLTLGGSGSGMNFRPVTNAPRTDRVPFEASVRRVQTLHHELGDGRLDILKLDIEGGEYAVLDDLLAGSLRPKQLLIEFHHHFPGIGIEKTVRAVEALAKAGYTIFHMSPRGLEMSFLYTPGAPHVTPPG